MHNPKEDDGERYTVCPIIKGLRGIEPLILYHKEESGSHCLLILDLKPRSTGLKLGSIIALRETEPLETLAKKYGVAPSKITEWKNELLDNADKAFGKDSQSKSELRKVTAEKDRLLKKVGQLTIDCDFFAKACEDAGLKVR